VRSGLFGVGNGFAVATLRIAVVAVFVIGTQDLLDRPIEELDEKCGILFLLRDVEGLSSRETAEALGLSKSNVEVRLLRARLTLRERMTRAFGDESARVDSAHDHDDR
jgi:hypothetical protein